MNKKITKKEYLERIINEGAKRVGFVPLFVQEDKSLLKVVLHQDPEALIFLPDYLQTQENFWSTANNKRYVLLSAPGINEKLPAKMIEWILDEKNSVVGFPYLQKEFPQFNDFTENAKRKFAISCLIEGRRIPVFAEAYSLEFQSCSINELKEFKYKLILMESLGKIVNEPSKNAVEETSNPLLTANDLGFKI